MITLKKQHRRYSDYKDSGVEWIGEIPSDWNTKRLKYVATNCFSNVDKKDYEDQNKVRLCNYVDVYKNNFITNQLDFMSSTANQREIKTFSIKKNDVLVTKDSETPDDIANPALVIENFDLVVCGYHLAMLRAKGKELRGDYLYWLLRAKPVNAHFETSAHGITRFGLSIGSFNNLNVFLPSIEEQRVIAEFLYTKNSTVDSIIEKKKQQIELLKEKRTALINKAVTRGLDDNAEMKDSGVEWIGEIPKRWKVEKLKFLSNHAFQYGANEAALDENTSNPRFVRITDINEEGNLRKETFKSLEPYIAAPFLLRNGDILFARSGATVGKTFQYRKEWGKCCYAGYLIRMTPDENRIKSDYLYYITKSPVYVNWKNSIFIQATIQNISAEKYKNFFIPIPSIKEQERILCYLDIEITKIEHAIKKIEQSILFLQEYKTSLISNVVTGKIKITV
jgi:restriction endonuclease S subunit